MSAASEDCCVDFALACELGGVSVESDNHVFCLFSAVVQTPFRNCSYVFMFGLAHSGHVDKCEFIIMRKKLPPTEV